MSLQKPALTLIGGTFDESNQTHLKKYRERAKKYKQQVKQLREELQSERINSANITDRFKELQHKKKTEDKLVQIMNDKWSLAGSFQNQQNTVS